jgi:hypothetical protein
MTYEEAIDDIFKTFKTAWDTSSASIVGYIPEVRWPGVEEPEVPDRSKYWVRISQQTIADEQKSFRNGTCRSFETAGLVFVQLFLPRSDSKSMQLGKKLANLSRNAFRKRSVNGGVWFRNSRIVEIPPEDAFFRLNVVAEYEYNENYEG